MLRPVLSLRAAPVLTQVLRRVLRAVLRLVLSLRLIRLVLHRRQSRLCRRDGSHVGGKHLGDSPPPFLWLVEGRGQQAEREQAGVGAELQLLLLEQLSNRPGGQLLEALLASGVDRHHKCLVEAIV